MDCAVRSAGREWGALGELRLEEGGEAEEGEEADDIGDGGEDDTGALGGVEVEFSHEEGDGGAG